MKRTKFMPVIVIVVGLLVTACGAFSLAAPGALSNSTGPSNGVASGPVNTPVVVAPQAPADVVPLQTAYEQVYQKVSPSVVTIEIGSRSNGNGQGQGGFGGGGGNGQGGQGGQ